MASTTIARARAVSTPTRGGSGRMIPEFGIFLDTHRDGACESFQRSIKRGWTMPTLVHFLLPDSHHPKGQLTLVKGKEPRGVLITQRIPVQDHFRFLETDWYNEWVIAYITDHGVAPFDSNGLLRTSHFRDARKRVYLVRTLRQMVVYHQQRAKKGT